MKLGVIGVGQAGGKVVDQLKVYDDEAEIGCVADAMVVNSSRADLVSLRHLPQRRRVLVGQQETEGHGAGTNCERAARITHDDIEKALYRVEEMPLGNIEAFLLVGALGGGMGSGGTAVVARYLRRRYNKPVYVTGMTPMEGESPLYKRNTVRALRTLIRVTNNVILFDNSEWSVEDLPSEQNYFQMNDDLVVRLAAVFGATEPLSSGDDIGEKVMDPADLKETLNEAHISSIGYADMDLSPDDDDSGGFLKGLFGGAKSAPEDSSEDINNLIQQAALGKLTLPVNNLSGTKAALGITAGPQDWLSQKGLSTAGGWLAEQTSSDYVRTGDYPVQTLEGNTDYLAGVVVLSGPRSVRPLVQLYDDVIGIEASGEEPVDASDVVEDLLEGSRGPDPIYGR